MRRVMVLMLAACGARAPAPIAVVPIVKVTLVAPAVSDAAAVAKDDVRPPYLYLLGDKVQLAATATWAELDRSDVTIAERTSTPREIEAFVRQQFDAGTPPITAVAAWARGAKPPPIEEEPPREDEHGERDGRDDGWTIVDFDEGQLGKKDSDRAEGQYKMKPTPPGPPRAPEPRGKLNWYSGALDPHGRPTRLAQVVGVTADVDQLAAMRSLIIAAPKVAARTLIELVKLTDGNIAVSHAGTIRPLRLQFLVDDYGAYRRDRHWIEVRVQPTGPVVVEAVADTTIESSLDPAELGAAITKAQNGRSLRGVLGVDVLVAPDVDAQRLVDVLVALELAGTKEIGMGMMPSGEELARRGHRIARLELDNVRVNGGISEQDISAALHAQGDAFLACDAHQVVNGNTSLMFFVAPTGIVVAANASPSPISGCLIGVLEALHFPSNHAGTQVAFSLALSY